VQDRKDVDAVELAQQPLDPARAVGAGPVGPRELRPKPVHAQPPQLCDHALDAIDLSMREPLHEAELHTLILALGSAGGTPT